MPTKSPLLKLLLAHLASPLGDMLVVIDEHACLRALDWSEYEERMHRLLRLHYGLEGEHYELKRRAPLRAIRTPIDAYFRGNLAALKSIPVCTGGTPFQRKVWQALRRIPAGASRTYGELAGSIGRPTAIRAVGHANGANPVGIVVPCHRLVGANGSLTGYGGGLERKRWLLAHEGVAVSEP